MDMTPTPPALATENKKIFRFNRNSKCRIVLAMNKNEIETMLHRLMEQNTSLVALVSQQQQQIQELSTCRTQGSHPRSLPEETNRPFTRDELENQKEKLLRMLKHLPHHAQENMPSISEWLEKHPIYRLQGLTDGPFFIMLERYVSTEAADAYITKRFTPRLYRRMVYYLDALADSGQLRWSSGDNAAARLKEEELRQAAERAAAAPALLPTAGAFELPGAEKLETFFNEQVVDIVNHYEKYSAMGISFPRPFILEGPPGCGKTYAVERLAEHLNWKTYHITSGTIGSTYIHDTARKTEKLFKEAKKNAPALVIIDELDAFMPNRSGISPNNLHHVEEVDCFLKCIQTAAENKVLVVGMTNHLNTIDPAILRTGRMGTHIRVDMPTADAAETVLRLAIEKRPHEEQLDYRRISEQLLNRPLSDVTYVAEEAAMTAVRANRARIAQEDMETALARLAEHTTPKEEHRPLGFCA